MNYTFDQWMGRLKTAIVVRGCNMSSCEKKYLLFFSCVFEYAIKLALSKYLKSFAFKEYFTGTGGKCK